MNAEGTTTESTLVIEGAKVRQATAATAAAKARYDELLIARDEVILDAREMRIGWESIGQWTGLTRDALMRIQRKRRPVEI